MTPNLHLYLYTFVLLVCVYIYIYVYVLPSVDRYYCFWKWFLRGLLLSFHGTFALTFAQHV